MDDTQQLLALIGQIYESALDPALWSDTLSKAKSLEARDRLVAPHLQRATIIGKAMAEAAVFADTFDGMGAGVFLVDAAGGIVHSNTAGHLMLKEMSVLHTVGKRLMTKDAQTNQMLADVFATAGDDDAPLKVRRMVVSLTARDGRHYAAHVLPLRGGVFRRVGASHPAVVALFVHGAALNTPVPLDAIARAYELTPTELRVLLSIVEVGGVPEVAKTLGIAETTVKTHLGRLYDKTGAGRQADLVKVVAGFCSQLLD